MELRTLITHLPFSFYGKGLLKKIKGPFNDQEKRAALFKSLQKQFDFDFIIETGTFAGDTTAFLAKTSKKPVYSIEKSLLYFVLSKKRFLTNPNIHLFFGDSVSVLQRLSEQETLTGKRPFVYLDAHDFKSSPALAELQIIFKTWGNAVVMIDDFEVPGDSGYSFSKFNGEKLSLPSSFHLFFPSEPSSSETGAKRGCVVVAQDSQMIAALQEIEGIRAFPFLSKTQ